MDVDVISAEMFVGVAVALLAAFAKVLVDRFGSGVLWPLLVLSVLCSVALGLIGLQTRDNSFTLAGGVALLGGIIGAATVLLRKPGGPGS
ncbi:hypothetical protein [Myceligenerans crystallogenes]|uniref:Uncharacterized protein n=1 Tax=Myceligenerans crystallogenes TaxID=316335 RepID=A0ABN2NI53_9MICO